MAEIILSISRAISTKSSAVLPLVVSAAVPMRTPLVCTGLRFSFGTQFLFSVIPCRSSSS